MKKQAFNPILPGWEYIPDGEPHVFGDRVYLYGSHDRFGGDDYCQNNYVCWSAPADDLSDWEFHGEIFNVTDDPLNKEGKHCGYAPDCCRGPDGRYYLYYALNNHLAMSVAVCDTPSGKFEFLGHMKTADGRIWGTEAGDAYVFDPGVLVDDDGRVHLYMGFSPTDGMKGCDLEVYLRRWDTRGAFHIELCDDMVTMKTDPALLIPGCEASKGTGFEGHAFFEAPSMRKLFGKYYFIYSSEHFQELCYAVSDTPNGPFEYRGRLVSNGDIGIDGRTDPINHIGNNHGSLCEIDGKYYIFYHRHTNNTPYSRQACAEDIAADGKGEFIQSEITSCGLNEGPLKAEGAYSAGIACNLYALTGDAPYITQKDKDGSEDDTLYITRIKDSAVIGFKYFDFKGNEQISVSVRSSDEGHFDLYTDLKGIPFGKIKIKDSDSAYIAKADGKPESGVHPLYLSYCGKGEAELESIIITNEREA